MKNILIFLSLILLCNQLVAQDLSKVIKDKKNYREIEEYLTKNKQILEKATEKELKMYNRWKWFWSSRVDSSGDLSKYSKAMRDYYESRYPKLQEQQKLSGLKTKSKKTAISESPTIKSFAAPGWESLGPNSRPSGTSSTIGRGRILSIWVDPSNFDHILIGAHSGGLWESSNGGTNWTCLTDNFPFGGVSSIAVHPTNSNIIYISTGFWISGSYGGDHPDGFSLGVFKSNNGGDTWANCNVPAQTTEHFQKVMIDPENSSRIFVMSDKNVYRSTNSGVSWINTNVGFFDGILQDMEFQTSNSDIIFLSGNNTLYRSTNGSGVGNWEDIKSDITYPNYSNPKIEIDTYNDELYVFYGKVSSPYASAILKSTDNGDSFMLVKETNLQPRGFAMAFEISPEGAIYAGGLYLYRSTNGGATFSSLTSNYIHVDFQDIYFPDDSDNDLIYVTNDGGVYMDDAGGTSWTNINGNLATNEFYDIAITDDDPNYMIGGTHDCGSYKRDINGNWIFIKGGDGGTTLIDHSNKDIYYVTSTPGGTPTLYRNSSYCHSLEGYNSPVAMHPTNPGILFMHDWQSGNPPVHILKSTNKGSSWTTIDQCWDHMRDFVVSKSNPNIMYYTIWDSWAPSSIRRTTDGGNNWDTTRHTGMQEIRQVAPINDIWVSPTDPNFVVVAFGGYSYEKKIMASYDGGNSSWEDLTSTGLPDLPIECIEYDAMAGKFIAGTDVGIFYRDFDGQWYLDTDFPQAIVTDIEINEASGHTVVATFGRGIWRQNPVCTNLSPINISTTVNWNTDRTVCGDISINNGGTLNIQAEIFMPTDTKIIVKNGGNLVLAQGAEFCNFDIIVESGGSLTINSNGQVYMNTDDELQINEGGIFNFNYGSVEIMED